MDKSDGQSRKRWADLFDVIETVDREVSELEDVLGPCLAPVNTCESGPSEPDANPTSELVMAHEKMTDQLTTIGKRIGFIRERVKWE